MKYLYHTILIVLLIVSQKVATAQSEEARQKCLDYLGASFISDDQEYFAQIENGKVAKFEVTLFGGVTYRIATCIEKKERGVIFSVYDEERHLLFTNKKYSNAPFWDFKIEDTITVTIETELAERQSDKECIALEIGFKH